MKRSEFIKKVAEMMEDHSNNQQYKGYSHEGLAEVFLDIAEELGMKPNFIIKDKDGYGVYDPVPTVTPTGNLDYSFKRGWENE